MGDVMKKSYLTQQKRILLDFLKSTSNSQYTIEEISLQLSDKNSIGKSTLYRIMNALVEEGKVSRIPCGNSRHFVYQYLDCPDCHRHFHLKCTKCGALYHLGNKESEIMHSVISLSDNFVIDESKSILMGTCGKCIKASKDTEV